MHTTLVILGGLVLLGAFVLVGRFVSSSGPTAWAAWALWFIPVWLVVAAGNMWLGVKRAGYSVGEELPIFLLVAAVPAIVATLVWWRLSRH